MVVIRIGDAADYSRFSLGDPSFYTGTVVEGRSRIVVSGRDRMGRGRVLGESQLGRRVE